MMFSPATLLVIGLVLLSYNRARSLHSFIAEVKTSGLPHIILPIHPFGASWVFAQHILVPLINLLPKRLTERWLPLLLLSRSWQDGHEPFRHLGCDTFIAASPTGNICYTCDSQLVHQLLRSSLVDKPANLMNVLNIFGPTMTGTRNQESRTYRKVTMPFFNETNMQDVWNKSLSGAEAVLKVLMGDKRSTPIRDLRPTFARLSLHLLKTVCFESSEDPVAELEDRGQLTPGHRLTFSQAMHAVINYMPILFLVPPLLLTMSPFRSHRAARQAYLELSSYMEELRDSKMRSIGLQRSVMGNSILDLIVQASLSRKVHNRPTVSPAAVLGNIFIFMFAGHEANANTVTFIIILLACHPIIQRHLQHDVDRIIGSPTEASQSWSYGANYPLLSESMLGAVVHETLRLFGALPFIPKRIPDGSSQAFNIAGECVHIPPGTLILLNTSALHRNPKYWAHLKHEAPGEAKHNPVADFNPAAWLYNDSDDTESSQGTSRLRRPQDGSFVPFSDGSRGCLGKKFALVELCAVIARIFGEYSVELALEETDPVEAKGSSGGKITWEEARKRAEHQLCAGLDFKMSLRLAGTVPLNLVKR